MCLNPSVWKSFPALFIAFADPTFQYAVFARLQPLTPSFSLAPELDQSASQCNSQVFHGLLDEDEIVDTFLARMLHPASEPLVPQTGSEFGCSLYTDAALRLQHRWRSRPSKVEGDSQSSLNNFHLFTPDIIVGCLANRMIVVGSYQLLLRVRCSSWFRIVLMPRK